MKIKGLTACLILLSAAACAAPTGIPGATPANTLAAIPTPLATEPAVTGLTPAPSPSAVLTVPASSTAQPPAIATSRFPDGPTSTPTIPSPRTPVAPAATPTLAARSSPAAPTGWKTFTSQKLQVTLAYPPDWTAREDNTGVSFTSATNALIVLARVNTAGASPEDFLSETLLPNVRCTAGVNAHSLIMRACLDTVGFAQSAYLYTKSPGGPALLWSLSTRSRDATAVLNTMAGSVQPSP